MSNFNPATGLYEFDDEPTSSEPGSLVPIPATQFQVPQSYGGGLASSLGYSYPPNAGQPVPSIGFGGVYDGLNLPTAHEPTSTAETLPITLPGDMTSLFHVPSHFDSLDSDMSLAGMASDQHQHQKITRNSDQLRSPARGLPPTKAHGSSASSSGTIEALNPGSMNPRAPIPPSHSLAYQNAGIHSAAFADEPPTQQSRSPTPPLGLSDHNATAGGSGGPSSGGAAGGVYSNANAAVDFTKKKNWTTTVVKHLQAILFVLNAEARVLSVSGKIQEITGYTFKDFHRRFLKDFLHDDDVGYFVSEMHESIATGNPFRIVFRISKRDGDFVMLEATGHGHIAPPRFAPNPLNKSPFCEAVFMTATPLGTDVDLMMNSFLEHKMENERLKSRIAELRAEGYDESESLDETDEPKLQDSPGSTSEDISAPEGIVAIPPPAAPHDDYFQRSGAELCIPQTQIPDISATAPFDLLPFSAAGFQQFETDQFGLSFLSSNETIEYLTGICFPDTAEKIGMMPLNSISRPGAESMVPTDQDTRAGDKKKRLKTSHEYVCTDCGTLESPEWRKGPSGPKTLCNACGLRWAKKRKKDSVGL